MPFSRIQLAVLGLVVSLILPASAGAAFPGRNGEIAVSARFGCDGFEIDTVHRMGGERRRLTVSPCSAEGDGRQQQRARLVG